MKITEDIFGSPRFSLVLILSVGVFSWYAYSGALDNGRYDIILVNHPENYHTAEYVVLDTRTGDTKYINNKLNHAKSVEYFFREDSISQIIKVKSLEENKD